MKTYIVIGGGILGASTAYHLSKKSGVEIILIDRNDKGQATDAAAGIVCPWLTQRRNKAWFQLAKSGARYYSKLIKELNEAGETDTGYAKVGAISLHTDDVKLDKLEERALKRRQDAPEVGKITRLTPKDTRVLVPCISEGYGSVHISGGARVNGRALRDSLVRAARNNGAKILQTNARLAFKDDEVVGVHVNDGIILADQVVVTSGAWSGEILKPLGVKFLVSAQKAQIVHLRISNLETQRWPVVMPPNNQYILGFDNGRVVVGATHEDKVGFDNRVTAGVIHEILQKALTIAPGLKEAKILDTRVGFRPFTPGFLPVIGPLPDFKGIIIANGLGASGLTVGPYLGSELAKLAFGEEHELNLDDYDVAGAIQVCSKSMYEDRNE